MPDTRPAAPRDVLALVPARGGSKGIPGKNLARVGGRSLLARAVEAGLGSRRAPRVVVTTDDEAIAEEGRRAGAEVPFLRPAGLARDDTPGMAPVLHALRWLEEHEGARPEWVVLLQPTSPLRTAEDVDAALDLAEAKDADAVVSVMPSPVHPRWLRGVEPDGRLAPPETSVPATRQALEAAYALNGALYLARREVLLERETWYTGRTWAYVMPPERSLDVDTPWDLHLADLVLTHPWAVR